MTTGTISLVAIIRSPVTDAKTGTTRGLYCFIFCGIKNNYFSKFLTNKIETENRKSLLTAYRVTKKYI